MIRLTTGPRGGQKYGDGWWEGQWLHCILGALWRASSRRGRLSLRLISPHLVPPAIRLPREPEGNKLTPCPFRAHFP